MAVPTRAEVVTLQDDGGTKYVNMPATGTNTLTLSDASVTSFMVYDSGGKKWSYEKKCTGQLVLTAPVGYLLQLSGSIKAEKFDKLYVYDNNQASGSKLLDGVTSQPSKVLTNIPTVTSSGQSMTLQFASDRSDVSDGFELTVTLIRGDIPHSISVASVAGGSVTSSPTSAKAKETVTLTSTPSTGYLLQSIRVTDKNGAVIAVTGSEWYSQAPMTFTMPGSDVTVTPTFTNECTESHFDINIPQTGSTTVAIPSAMKSFKVYDDGGKDGNYHNSCTGSLVLTAPEGYLLQLSGTIQAEAYDKLTVYDNDEASGDKLRDAVTSNPSRSLTDIPVVTSSTRSITLQFLTDGTTNDAGLNLTVTLVKGEASHRVSITPTEGGSVTSNKASAKLNDIVSLSVTPVDGYLLQGIRVTDSNGNVIAVEGGNWHTQSNATFRMPSSNVTVTPAFTRTWTAEYLHLNLPKTGTTTLTLPMGMLSFKVYDDGGKDGSYSNGCDGTLVLTAPAGRMLRLSGSLTSETYDKLWVYNGSEASDTPLLEGVYSSTNHAYTPLNAVVSSGRSLRLYFKTDGSVVSGGLDLTVEVISDMTPTPSFTHQTQRAWELQRPSISGVPHDYTGQPTYHSSNEAAVKVDANGMLSPGGNDCFGQTATITIQYPATANYSPATASYTIEVVNEQTLYIDEATDMALLAQTVEAGLTNLNGALTQDVTLAPDAPMVGSEAHPYSGTFDGQGHTLTVQLTGTGRATAPFSHTASATLKNLTLAGSITAPAHVDNNYTAGLVGIAQGTTLQRCIVQADIHLGATGPVYASGLVGRVQSGHNRIEDCAFFGSLTGDNGYVTQLAGLVGSGDEGTLTLKYCLVDATYTQVEELNPVVRRSKQANNNIIRVYYSTKARGMNADENMGGDIGEEQNESEIVSGQLVQLLQGDRSDRIHWGQVLGDKPRLYREGDKGQPNYVYYHPTRQQWVCGNFQLSEGKDMLLSIDFTADYARYDRTFVAAQGVTICLPFDYPISGFKAYTLSGYEGSTLHFQEVKETLKAYHPYYIIPDGLTQIEGSHVQLKAYYDSDLVVTVGNYKFAGTVQKIENAIIPINTYILQSDGLWHPINKENPDVYIPSFRAFISIEGLATKALRFTLDDDTTTDLRAIQTTDADGSVRYYDLNGRYIGTTLDGQPSGIYVGNGQKVVHP